MTIIEQPSRTEFELVTEDLYREIHKGIRAELFDVVAEAGRLDPGARASRVDLAGHIGRVVELLVSHAEHEDRHIQPAIELHLPEMADRIVTDHVALESRMDLLQEMAAVAVDARTADQPARVHRLYLELASFTSAYLEHQDVEERVVMPALEAAIGLESTTAIHQAILGSIPPDEMARSLALMLPPSTWTSGLRCSAASKPAPLPRCSRACGVSRARCSRRPITAPSPCASASFECGREDLNLHPVARTSTSSWRVYLIPPRPRGSRSYTLSLRSPATAGPSQRVTALTQTWSPANVPFTVTARSWTRGDMTAFVRNCAMGRMGTCCITRCLRLLVQGQPGPGVGRGPGGGDELVDGRVGEAGGVVV